MAEFLLGGLASLAGGGAAAGTAASVAVPGIAGAATLVPAGAAAAAGSGFSLASVLSGTATVLGVLSSLNAGEAEAAKLNLEADDAEREQNLETLQGVSRRSSIKRAMMDALGAQDVAYAASGADLSFGTAAEARREAYREADLALTTSTGTEEVRGARLMERARNYRIGAKRARGLGQLNALGGAISGVRSFVERY